MKIFYFNDRIDNALVCVDDLLRLPTILKPAMGEFFEVNIKSNQVPFIKVWNNGSVLISGIDVIKD